MTIKKADKKPGWYVTEGGQVWSLTHKQTAEYVKAVLRSGYFVDPSGFGKRLARRIGFRGGFPKWANGRLLNADDISRASWRAHALEFGIVLDDDACWERVAAVARRCATAQAAADVAARVSSGARVTGSDVKWTDADLHEMQSVASDCLLSWREIEQDVAWTYADTYRKVRDGGHWTRQNRANGRLKYIVQRPTEERR